MRDLRLPVGVPGRGTVSAEFVFGYGSLVAALDPVPTRAFDAAGFVTELPGFRRTWGVAMNNRVDLSDYKYYLDERGDRPDIHVAFLDIRPTPGSSVNGVCAPVDAEQLSALDARERNYVRVDVTASLAATPDQIRVWAYVGSAAGRGRLAAARHAGSAVIHHGYREAVAAAFKRLGGAEYEACLPSLDPDGLPVLNLTRRAV